MCVFLLFSSASLVVVVVVRWLRGPATQNLGATAPLSQRFTLERATIDVKMVTQDPMIMQTVVNPPCFNWLKRPRRFAFVFGRRDPPPECEVEVYGQHLRSWTIAKLLPASCTRPECDPLALASMSFVLDGCARHMA